MFDFIVDVIIDESKWLTMSLVLASVAILYVFGVIRKSPISSEDRYQLLMNLFFGVMLGSMAFGHVLAVTTKLLLGILEGPIFLFYLIGIVLALPSWWLTLHTLRLVTLEAKPHKKALFLNIFVVLSLLVMGLHNLPLAAPGILNVAFQVQSHKTIRWVIVYLFMVISIALLIGSLVFFISGQDFEQFRNNGG